MAKETLTSRILVDLLVRLVYFVGGVAVSFVVILVLVTQGARMGLLEGLGYGELLVAPLIGGVLCAAFGPYLYREATTRGRGKLSEIREKSRPKS